jgi:hypothetical protein
MIFIMKIMEIRHISCLSAGMEIRPPVETAWQAVHYKG